MFSLPIPTDSHYSLSAGGLAALALAALLVLTGCDSNSANDANDDPAITDVAIVPDSASLAVDQQVDFSVVGLTAAGDTVRDTDLDVEWWSTDPAVFTVAEGGTATGQRAGTAYCKVELSGETADTALHLKRAKRIFVGRDSAFVSVF